jgi:hypothetical protein
MNQIIDQIKTTLSGIRKGKQEQKPSQNSVNWFSKKLQTVSAATKGKVNPNRDNFKKQIINEDVLAKKAFKYKKPGYIYFFHYQPPDARKLPFYDRFPIVLSLGFAGTTMIGLNLHYLPLRIRLALMLRILKSIAANSKPSNRIRVNTLFSSPLFVKYIMASTKFGLERFDMRGIKSKIKLVTPDEFIVMAFLPVQKFVKKTDKAAYRMFNQVIRGKA